MEQHRCSPPGRKAGELRCHLLPSRRGSDSKCHRASELLGAPPRGCSAKAPSVRLSARQAAGWTRRRPSPPRPLRSRPPPARPVPRRGVPTIAPHRKRCTPRARAHPAPRTLPLTRVCSHVPRRRVCTHRSARTCTQTPTAPPRTGASARGHVSLRLPEPPERVSPSIPVPRSGRGRVRAAVQAGLRGRE